MSNLNIPDSWAESTLESLCEFIRNGYSTKQTKDGVGDPISRIETIATGAIDFNRVGFANLDAQRKQQYRIRVGDILFSHINSLEHIGKTAVLKSDEELYHGMNLLLLRPQKFVNPFFLTYFLKTKSTRDYFRAKCKRAINQVSINTKEVGALSTPVPPIGEQIRIVAKIESTQEKIKTIEESVSKAEELIGKYRESLLQKAFRGQLVQQDPNDEPASELLKRIRAERAQTTDTKKKKKEDLPPISEDEIPFQIPKSWEWVRLSDICNSISDGDHQAPPQVKSGIPFLVISNIRHGDIDLTNTRFVPETYYERLASERRPKLGDILYTVTGSFGISVPVKTSNAFCFQRHIALLKVSRFINATFLNALLNTSLVFDQATTCATGSAQKTVPLSGLRNFLIPMPPSDEQERIALKISQSSEVFYQHLEVLSQTKSAIQKMKSSILSYAFTGRLVPQIATEGTGLELLSQIDRAHIIAGAIVTKQKSSQKKLPKKKIKK